MTQPSTATPPAFAAFVGIDWADQEHAVCLSPADTLQPEQTTLPHTPAALAEFVTQLRTRFGGRPVAIGLEQARGALVYALLGHDFLVLYPINPVTAHRYRAAFNPGGAKDDPLDARLLWELLVKHRDQLRPWRPDDPATRQLALLCEHRRDLVNQRTRYVQQLTAALKTYFPQALDWTGANLATVLAADFIVKWPTLADLQQAKHPTIRAFYYAHHCRRPDLVSQRLAQIKTATALTTDSAVIAAHALRAQSLARQLRPLLTAIAAYDHQIAALFATHPAAPIFNSFPGAGPCLAPRLVAAFGTQRERFPTADALARLSGLAPVTRRSGQSHTVHRRHACAKFLLQTFHEWARCSLQTCAWARLYYQRQRAKGHGHHAAVRALAFKWLRILWRCWQDRQPYCETVYTTALLRAGSPLAAGLAAAGSDCSPVNKQEKITC
jgi:transposase